ncbi:rhodanese-like domain-containing protein [Seonamhaeicola aphaedonensis]|uniref:Rhodanese-related sulfurtransferase n=1 Tax=Seonamhaeicola aphaedonensis TaxID=1461338 RepID=A0A3D9HH63_9FLAO|nr:rhodanese-like domain-containing protein [Seonamhaeicola aphaedonensis]RED48306.1 rhodanese-related sulfurtransferase [Seonamhaeicola aphaedonensis]
MEDLTQEEWAEQLATDDNAVILDVRTEAEVADGIIPNAIHIDFYLGEEFLDKVDELDKSKNYYVYCRSGNRSHKACLIMEELGFDNAYNLEGGMLNWTGDVVDMY